MVPGKLQQCSECNQDAPPPKFRKIGASESLVMTDREGFVVLTDAGDIAADTSEVETAAESLKELGQGRGAKLQAARMRDQNKIPKQVQSLTMTKENLALKIWGGKRGELWQCEKSSSVTHGTQMVHSAGRFVGICNVLETKRVTSVREALLWKDHRSYVPHSPSIDYSVTFHLSLFTKQRADKDKALAWDLENAFTKRNKFYAWMDKHESHYIAHDDGRHPWMFPQEKPRQTKTRGRNSSKAEYVGRPRPKATGPIPSYRGCTISTAGRNFKHIEPANGKAWVLGEVTRKKTKKQEKLQLVAKNTAFEVIKIVIPFDCDCNEG